VLPVPPPTIAMPRAPRTLLLGHDSRRQPRIHGRHHPAPPPNVSTLLIHEALEEWPIYVRAPALSRRIRGAATCSKMRTRTRLAHAGVGRRVCSAIGHRPSDCSQTLSRGVRRVGGARSRDGAASASPPTS